MRNKKKSMQKHNQRYKNGISDGPDNQMTFLGQCQEI